MPITQQTLLLVYGELSDLVEAIDKINALTTLRFTNGKKAVTATELAKAIARLRSDALLAQRSAIGAMLEAEPTISINPLTGAVE